MLRRQDEPLKPRAARWRTWSKTGKGHLVDRRGTAARTRTGEGTQERRVVRRTKTKVVCPVHCQLRTCDCLVQRSGAKPGDVTALLFAGRIRRDVAQSVPRGGFRHRCLRKRLLYTWQPNRRRGSQADEIGPSRWRCTPRAPKHRFDARHFRDRRRRLLAHSARQGQGKANLTDRKDLGSAGQFTPSQGSDKLAQAVIVSSSVMADSMSPRREIRLSRRA